MSILANNYYRSSYRRQLSSAIVYAIANSCRPMLSSPGSAAATAHCSCYCYYCYYCHFWLLVMPSFQGPWWCEDNRRSLFFDWLKRRGRSTNRYCQSRAQGGVKLQYDRRHATRL
jgi:hypothetical protein